MWMEHASLLGLVENEALYDALKVENPNQRAEVGTAAVSLWLLFSKMIIENNIL